MYRIKPIFILIKKSIDDMTYQSTAVTPADFDYDLVVESNSITFEISVKDQSFYSRVSVDKHTKTESLLHFVKESIEFFKSNLIKEGILNNISYDMAFNLLMSGSKITHRCFSHGECIWVDPSNGEIVNQDNQYYFSVLQSMSYDINYKTGWSLYPKRFS